MVWLAAPRGFKWQASGSRHRRERSCPRPRPQLARPVGGAPFVGGIPHGMTEASLADI